MKFSSAVFLTLASCASVHPAEILWREEFDGTSSEVNSENWNVQVGNNGGWSSGEIQIYTDSNNNLQVVNGEYLTISVREEVASADGSPTFSSARIDTRGNMEFKYGTLSARIQNPDTKAGINPSFWTTGVLGDWPASGQITVMNAGEGLAIDQGVANQRVASSVVYDDNGVFTTASGWLNCEDITSDFFVYTVDWTPTTITTYMNDALIWTKAIDAASCSDCEEFHQPQFVVLNVAVGGGFTSPGGDSSNIGCAIPDGIAGCGDSLRTGDDITAPLPAVMKVDWVRLFDNDFTELTVANREPLPTESTVSSPISPVYMDYSPVSLPSESTVATPSSPVNLDMAPTVQPPAISCEPVSSPISGGDGSVPPPVVAVPVVAPVPVPVVVPVADPVMVPVTVPVMAPVPVPVVVPVPVPVVAPIQVPAVVQVPVTVPSAVQVPVAVPVEVLVPVAVLVPVQVPVIIPVPIGVPVGVPVTMPSDSNGQVPAPTPVQMPAAPVLIPTCGGGGGDGGAVAPPIPCQGSGGSVRPDPTASPLPDGNIIFPIFPRPSTSGGGKGSSKGGKGGKGGNGGKGGKSGSGSRGDGGSSKGSSKGSSSDSRGGGSNGKGKQSKSSLEEDGLAFSSSQPPSYTTSAAAAATTLCLAAAQFL